MITKIRSFEPGDATRYIYAIQHAEDEYGNLVHLFSFGPGARPMVTASFLQDWDVIDYYYFLDKFGRAEKNLHTVYVAYLVFCYLTNRRPDGHEVNPSHGRKWNVDAWLDLQEYGEQLTTA